MLYAVLVQTMETDPGPALDHKAEQQTRPLDASSNSWETISESNQDMGHGMTGGPIKICN
jgi:hypothetical protein